MLTKNWNPGEEMFDVSFDLPAELQIDQAAVVGDFNGWDPEADPMRRADSGRWTVVLRLRPGSVHRFRYHLGHDRWENDWSADDYVPNEYGGSDSVVVVPEPPSEPPEVKKAPAKKAATSRSKSATKKAAKSATKKAAKSATKKAATRKSATKKAATGKGTTEESTAERGTNAGPRTGE